jgi:hypothetical protein
MSKQRVKDFAEDLLNTLISIVRIILFSKKKANLPKLPSNFNECNILANGPSLNESVNKHRDHILSRTNFAVNFFAISSLYSQIKPSYYVMVAPEFWIETSPTQRKEEMRQNLFKILAEQTNWGMNLFIPFEASKSKLIQKLLGNHEFIKIFYFNVTPVEGFRFFRNILFRCKLGMPRPYNVLIPSIYLALTMGFKRVYLFGADHSWHEEIKIDDTNEVTVNHQHFYDKGEQRLPMYKLDGKEYHIHDIFNKLHLAFKGYFILKEYAENIGAKIYNASLRSYIDAFEKITVNK